LLRHDARGLRGRKGRGLGRSGELLHLGDCCAQRVVHSATPATMLHHHPQARESETTAGSVSQP